MSIMIQLDIDPALAYIEIIKSKHNNLPLRGVCGLTCILSIESDCEQAFWMRYVWSIYSEILCRKLRGSLNTMGMVIFDSS